MLVTFNIPNRCFTYPDHGHNHWNTVSISVRQNAGLIVDRSKTHDSVRYSDRLVSSPIIKQINFYHAFIFIPVYTGLLSSKMISDNQVIRRYKSAMENNLTQNQRKIYQAVIITWSILTISVVSLIVVFDLQRAKTLFKENATLHYQTVSDRAHIIESILEGFAAMVSVTNDLGRERIRGHAQEILERYPHIFMFEIVEKVSHKQVNSDELVRIENISTATCQHDAGLCKSALCVTR